MLRSVNDLQGEQIHARDGEICFEAEPLGDIGSPRSSACRSLRHQQAIDSVNHTITRDDINVK